jgi:hypothetical protein
VNIYRPLPAHFLASFPFLFKYTQPHHRESPIPIGACSVPVLTLCRASQSPCLYLAHQALCQKRIESCAYDAFDKTKKLLNTNAISISRRRRSAPIVLARMPYVFRYVLRIWSDPVLTRNRFRGSVVPSTKNTN